MKKGSPEITEDLIKALKEGDQNALQVIFTQMQPKIYRLLWYKVKSVETAEDLVQETFLRLWETRTRLKSSNIETYLYRVATNLATDQLRKTDRKKEQAENRDINISETSSDNMAESNQLAQIVDQALQEMPEAPRTAFILSRYEELSHKEIAEVMNISVKTVEKHIGKALQLLKVKLQKLDLISPS